VFIDFTNDSENPYVEDKKGDRSFPTAFEAFGVRHAESTVGDILRFVSWVVFDVCGLEVRGGTALLRRGTGYQQREFGTPTMNWGSISNLLGWSRHRRELRGWSGEATRNLYTVPTYSGMYSIWVLDCPHVSRAVLCPAHENGPLHPVSYGAEWAKYGQQ